MLIISTKSRVYSKNKNRNPSIFLFTVCWNWNATHIVLPSKKLLKSNSIDIILAGIYMHLSDMKFLVKLVSRVNNQIFELTLRQGGHRFHEGNFFFYPTELSLSFHERDFGFFIFGYFGILI